MLLVGVEELVIGKHFGRFAGGFEDDRSHVEFVEPDVQNRVVELAGEFEQPKLGALRNHRISRRGRGPRGAAQQDGRDPRGAVEFDGQGFVLDRVVGEGARKGGEVEAHPADCVANSLARASIVSSNFEPGTTTSTSRHSTARLPLTPSSVVQKTSAWSRRARPL